MGTLAQDTFIRANQANWGTSSDGKTWSHTGGQTLTITSNQGTMNGGFGIDVMLLGSGTAGTCEASVRVLFDDSGDGVWLILRAQDSSNYYAFGCGLDFNSYLEISKFASGSSNDLGHQFFGPSSGTEYWIKANANGSTLKLKMWADGSAEPDWMLTVTDSSYSSGQYGIGDGLRSNAVTPAVDTYLVTDGSSVTTSTRTIPCTAALKATSTRTVSCTAALLATRTRTITATAALKATSTRTISTSAALLATRSRTISCSVALYQTSTRTVACSVALKATRTRTVPASVPLLQTRTRTIPATAALKTTLARTVVCTVALQVTNTRTITCHVALQATSARTIACSAAFKATKTRTIVCSVSLAGKFRIIPCTVTLQQTGNITTNAIVYVRSGEAIAFTRSGEAIAYVREP